MTSKIKVIPPSDKQMMFGQLLKERRTHSKMTQNEFAEIMHVTRNTIINWEADKSKPDYSLIPKICSILGIHIHELFHMDDESKLSDLEERVVGNIRKLNPASRRMVDKIVSVMVDEEYRERDRTMKAAFDLFLIRTVTAYAGTGNHVPEEPPTYTFLRKNTINTSADGIVMVHGDSMEPVYHNGDYVYYQESNSAYPGEDVIVDTDDGTVIKRVHNDMTLYSVNPDISYPKKTEDNCLVICGRVLGTVHSSDRASEEETGILQELFVDEIREFNSKHGLNN